MIIVIFLGGLFLILSIILLSGKGSMLISGYNTASKEEKERYDKEKLSRAAGVMLLLITIAYILMAYYNNLYTIIAFTFFVGIAIVVTTIYVKKKCQKTIPEGKKKVSFQVIFGICFMVFLVLLVSIPLYFYSKPPVYSINDSTFSISTEYGETINLSDIKRLQLKNDLPQGLKKVVGINLGTILKGNFTSKDGDLTVYIDTAHPPFIFLSTTTGLIIINDRTKTDTQSLYNQLEAEIKQK